MAHSQAPAWHDVDKMPTPRAYLASAVLGGRLYVAGGSAAQGTGETFPDSVDVYDPSTGHWKTLGHVMQGREYVRAVADEARNRIIFSGGSVPFYMPSAEVDVTSVDGGVSVGSLASARYLHASAVAAGKVIVSGGWGLHQTAAALLDDAEILEVDGSTWQPAGKMPAGSRAGHTMTTLANGTDVLVVGGCGQDGGMTQVDLFDAAKEAWSSQLDVKTARCRHTAVLLPDGRVIVAGSLNLLKVEASAELYDPAARTWTDASPMSDARFDHAMVVLPDGRVLVVGGSNNAADGEIGALNSVEVYDPGNDTWTAAPPMQESRRWPALAALADGIYVAGGSNSSGQLQTVERLTWADLDSHDSGMSLDAAVSGDAETDAGDADAGDAETADADAGDADTGTVDHASAESDADAAYPSHRQSSGCSCEVAGLDMQAPGLGGVLAMLVIVTRQRPKGGRRPSAAERPRRVRHELGCTSRVFPRHRVLGVTVGQLASGTSWPGGEMGGRSHCSARRS